MEIIDGRALAKQIQNEVKTEIKQLGITPGLAVILVGDNPASHLYVSLKEAAAEKVGIHFEKHIFSGSEPQADILTRIQELNERNDIHGMIVQVPLPKNYDEDVVIAQMDPKKDADGFHQANLRAILSGEPRIMPAVALAIVALIDAAVNGVGPGLAPDRGTLSVPDGHAQRGGRPQGPPLQNKKAVLIVNRTEFAAPVELLLEERGALVHIILRAKEMTPEIVAQIKSADVVVAARGHAHIINGNMLKDGAIVIDIGTNKLPSGRTVGDVDFSSTLDKPGFITPVPGGVGPMTVAMLLKNTLELATRSIPLP